MTGSTTAAEEVANLIVEGNAALLAGDSYSARQRFRRALELDPERVEAWIGLAGTVRPYREKREHLQRALTINPEHPDALAVLAQVEARMAAGEVLAPGGGRGKREPEGLLAKSKAAEAEAEAETQVEAQAEAQAEAQTLTAEPEATDELLGCYIHPDRDTGLRCTSCERPICGECATRAAVGQLCPECTKMRRPVNYQVGSSEILIAGAIAFFFSFMLSFVALELLLRIYILIGFIIAFFAGSIAGDFMVRLIDRGTKNKRGKPIQLALSIGYTLGVMPWILLHLLVFGFPFALVLFSIIAVSTALNRVR